MRKTIFFILLALSIMAVFADDVVKVLQVYSGGKKVSIPVSNIDSLNHSMYDTDNIIHSDYATSVAWTIDSIYHIPIASIDSMVIGDYDVNQYEENVESILDFISKQTELDVDVFQNNLLEWLNGKESIREATINNNMDIITVSFKDGLSFFVNFHYIANYGDYQDGEKQSSIVSRKTIYKNEFIDVSYQSGEEIIFHPSLLYVEGATISRNYGNYFSDEIEQIEEEKKSSPVNFEIVKEPKNPSFTDNDLSKYDIIIISQTHGLSDKPGWFIIEDTKATIDKFCGLSLLVDARNEIVKEIGIAELLLPSPIYIFISPQSIAKKISNSNPIIYGNYCWSYFLTRYIKNCTIFGYVTQSEHSDNVRRLVNFIANMANGLPYNDAVDLSSGSAWIPTLGTFPVMPKTNDTNSKKRFFSIKTDDVTFDESGKPIISGKINGYENLKPVDYFLFEYDVEDTDNSEWGSGTIDVKPDGTFKLTCTDDLVVGKEYGFLFGFSYGNNHYYGEAKFAEIPERPLCPDDNHPHMIDLGLPSGTKWACCNVGASAPEQYGGYYAWGETEEKDVYDRDSYKYYQDGSYVSLAMDISGTEYDVAHVKWGDNWVMPSLDDIRELLSNCTSEWTTLNGVKGRKFTSEINGNSIFLPAAGYRLGGSLDCVGTDGNYWSSTPTASTSIRSSRIGATGTIGSMAVAMVTLCALCVRTEVHPIATWENAMKRNPTLFLSHGLAVGLPTWKCHSHNCRDGTAFSPAIYQTPIAGRYADLPLQ